MNRLQRRGIDPRIIPVDRTSMARRISDAASRVGMVSGKSSGPDDSIMFNPAYESAQIELSKANKGEDGKLTAIPNNPAMIPLRYATKEDFPDNPVPPYIYKSCLK